MTGTPQVVFFDLGNVVMPWSPRRLYAELIPDPVELDRGRSHTDVLAEVEARHPEHGELIWAYWTRWPETLAEPIAGTVEIIDELGRAGVPRYALSNFARSTFDRIVEDPRFAVLHRLDGWLLSGDVGVIKPDPAIYAMACERFRVEASHAVDAARNFGMTALLFTNPDKLRHELISLGLPLEADPGRHAS